MPIKGVGWNSISFAKKSRRGRRMGVGARSAPTESSTTALSGSGLTSEAWSRKQKGLAPMLPRAMDDGSRRAAIRWRPKRVANTYANTPTP